MILVLHEGVLKVFLLNRQAISNKNVLLFFDTQASVLMQNPVNKGQLCE